MNVMCLEPYHRTCFGAGFGSDVAKRPFKGDERFTRRLAKKQHLKERRRRK